MHLQFHNAQNVVYQNFIYANEFDTIQLMLCSFTAWWMFVCIGGFWRARQWLAHECIVSVCSGSIQN